VRATEEAIATWVGHYNDAAMGHLHPEAVSLDEAVLEGDAYLFAFCESAVGPHDTALTDLAARSRQRGARTMLSFLGEPPHEVVAKQHAYWDAVVLCGTIADLMHLPNLMLNPCQVVGRDPDALGDCMRGRVGVASQSHALGAAAFRHAAEAAAGASHLVSVATVRTLGATTLRSIHDWLEETWAAADRDYSWYVNGPLGSRDFIDFLALYDDPAAASAAMRRAVNA